MSAAGYFNIGAGSEAESIYTFHRALDVGVTQIDPEPRSTIPTLTRNSSAEASSTAATEVWEN